MSGSLENTEHHPFINFYTPQLVNTLVLGSFPCKNQKGDYGEWFYLSSGKNYFWPVMEAVFETPGLSSQNKIISFCEQHQIFISDVFKSIQRKRNSCADTNIIPLEYNLKEIRSVLQNHAVSTIIFTSQWVEHVFLRKFMPFISINWEIIKRYCPISPSPAANRAIGKTDTYKQLKKKGLLQTVFDYRVKLYQEIFKP